jgi:protein TonB
VTALPQTSPDKPRRPLRPLHGIPDRDKRGPTGLLLSTLIHGIIVLFLFLPPFIASQLDQPLTDGGGGPGAAGGGGGGTGGSGGTTIKPERVRYLQVAPIPQVKPAPTVTPPVIPPPTPPKEQPKPEPKPEVPPPTPTPAETKEAATTGPTVPTAGTGGGSGHDGSGGNGPGSGGGVGSGVGTGRGSGNGPGTGGGSGDIYPPQVTNLALLPIPVPNKVRPYKMIAWFDVDEKGNAKLIAFNPSKDGGYNKKIREMLAEVRFRPAVRPDGTPVRDTVSITAEAPR